MSVQPISTAGEPVAELEESRRLWKDGLARGHRMADFIEDQIGSLASKHVLEIGVGGGGIARAFHSRGASVVAGDFIADTLEALAVRQREWGKPLHLVRLDAVALPFAENSFDIVVLNGVLEYMGCRSEHGTPDVHQVRALTAICHSLRPGGWLYLAIENRFDPASLFRDPHTGQPLVSWLPRRFASLVSKTFSGDDYHHWTHSLNALKGLVRRAGFSDARVFLPVPSYQFPLLLQPESQVQSISTAWRDVWSTTSYSDLKRVTALGWKGRMFLRLMGASRSPALASAFVLLCRK